MDDKIRLHKQLAMGTLKAPPTSISCGCQSLAQANGGTGGNSGPNNTMLSDSARSGKHAG
jgi:hypothetical protein